jgi:hypothetical protein
MKMPNVLESTYRTNCSTVYGSTFASLKLKGFPRFYYETPIKWWIRGLKATILKSSLHPVLWIKVGGSDPHNIAVPGSGQFVSYAVRNTVLKTLTSLPLTRKENH